MLQKKKLSLSILKKLICMKQCVLLLAMLPVLAAAQNKLHITGKVKGIKEGELVSLTDVNRPSDTLAKGKVRNGVFTLSADLKEPMILNINMGANKKLMTFLDNSFVKWRVTIDQLQQIKLSGSSLHNDFKDFKSTFDPLFEQLTKQSQQYQQGLRSDSLMNAINTTKDVVQQQIDLFISKHKNSAVSAFLLAATIQLSDDILLTEKRVNSLKSAALDNMYGDLPERKYSRNKSHCYWQRCYGFYAA